MSVREKIAGDLVLLATSKATISTATTTAFDFGTPNDINLASVTAGQPGALYKHGYRILVVLAATTAGTTDTVSWVIQDADDSSGSIGTPATADTDGTLTGGTGTQYAATSVKLKYGRPWLRISIKSTGATDTFVGTCMVFAVPAVL